MPSNFVSLRIAKCDKLVCDVIVGKHDGVMQFRVLLFELQSVIRRVT